MNTEKPTFAIACFLISLAIVVIGVYVVLWSPNPIEAVHALQAEGWSDIHITDSGISKGFEGCASDDALYYRARGKNPKGDESHAIICCGAVFKACTVRIP